LSQIAFFTRDGDMRDRRSRISRPNRGALIRATNLKLTPMTARLPMLSCHLPVRFMSDIMPTATDSWTLSRTIMRYGIAICWFGVSTVISGCSVGYYVDPAAFTPKRPAHAPPFVGRDGD